MPSLVVKAADEGFDLGGGVIEPIGYALSQHQHLNQAYLQLPVYAYRHINMPVMRLFILIHPYTPAITTSEGKNSHFESVLERVYHNNQSMLSQAQQQEVEYIFLPQPICTALAHSLTRSIDDLNGIVLDFSSGCLTMVSVVNGRVMVDAGDGRSSVYSPLGGRAILDCFRYLVLKHATISCMESSTQDALRHWTDADWADLMFQVCFVLTAETKEPIEDSQYVIPVRQRTQAFIDSPVSPVINIPGWIRHVPFELWFSTSDDNLLGILHMELEHLKAIEGSELTRALDRAEEFDVLSHLRNLVSNFPYPRFAHTKTTVAPSSTATDVPITAKPKVNLFLSGAWSAIPGLQERILSSASSLVTFKTSPMTEQDPTAASFLGGCLIAHLFPPLRKSLPSSTSSSLADQISKRLNLSRGQLHQSQITAGSAVVSVPVLEGWSGLLSVHAEGSDRIGYQIPRMPDWFSTSTSTPIESVEDETRLVGSIGTWGWYRRREYG